MPLTKEFIIRVKYTYLGLDHIKLATEMQITNSAITLKLLNERYHISSV